LVAKAEGELRHQATSSPTATLFRLEERKFGGKRSELRPRTILSSNRNKYLYIQVAVQLGWRSGAELLLHPPTDMPLVYEGIIVC
jgi:hypothetical protein